MSWRGCTHVLNVRWTLSFAFYFGPTLVETTSLLFSERIFCKMDGALWMHRDARRELFNVVFFCCVISGFDFGQEQRYCMYARHQTGSGFRPASCRKQNGASVCVLYMYIWRHCATSLKVVGSISHGVIGIFHWHNPSGRTMVLVLTQLLTEMSTKNFSWSVKAAGA